MSVTPITITRAEAAVTIRAAYDAGTLGAQDPDTTGRYYEVSPTTKIAHRCAIGQLFSMEDAERLQKAGSNYMMADELITAGLLVVDDPDWFDRIQGAHDEWGAMVHLLDPTPGKDEAARDHFLRMLK